MEFVIKKREEHEEINEKWTLVKVDWKTMEKKAQKYGGNIELMMEKEYKMKANLVYPHYSIVSPGVLKFEDWVLKYKNIPHNRFFIDVDAEFQDNKILGNLIPDKDGTTWTPKVTGFSGVTITKTQSKSPVQQVSVSKKATNKKDDTELVKKTQTTGKKEEEGEKISMSKATVIKTKNKREKARLYRELGDFLYEDLFKKSLKDAHVDPVLILNGSNEIYSIELFINYIGDKSITDKEWGDLIKATINTRKYTVLKSGTDALSQPYVKIDLRDKDVIKKMVSKHKLDEQYGWTTMEDITESTLAADYMDDMVYNHVIHKHEGIEDWIVHLDYDYKPRENAYHVFFTFRRDVEQSVLYDIGKRYDVRLMYDLKKGHYLGKTVLKDTKVEELKECIELAKSLYQV